MSALRVLEKSLLSAAIACGAISAAKPASADTVDWANWGNAVDGVTNGSAAATFGTSGLTAQYSGEVDGIQPASNFRPVAVFSGGSIANAPDLTGGAIQVTGGPGSGSGTNTITFSQAVVNPVMAIVSLGNAGTPAQYDFNVPFTIESGGSSYFGGGSITSSGNNVLGMESSGTIQFIGTFTSISWTEPAGENWSGFTFGVPEVAVAAVPEPETYALMLAGLGAVGMFVRRRKQA